ncbi:hypothetical protein Tco_0829339 [Tanacetum coccineum]
MHTDSSREIRTEVDEQQHRQIQIQHRGQIQIQQQRGPNKGRRIAADKYRFSSREVRTEVDEEQSGTCIAQNHINTEMNGSKSDRQTTADLDRHQTEYSDNRFRHSSRSDIRGTADKPEQN